MPVASCVAPCNVPSGFTSLHCKLFIQAFGLDATYDVWPLLDVVDAAPDELIGDFLSGSDDSDVEFESIRVPG